MMGLIFSGSIIHAMPSTQATGKLFRDNSRQRSLYHSCRSDDVMPVDCLQAWHPPSSVATIAHQFPPFSQPPPPLSAYVLSVPASAPEPHHAWQLSPSSCSSAQTIPDSFVLLSNLRGLCPSRKNDGGIIPDGLPWSKLTLLHMRGNQLRAVPCSALAGSTQLQVTDCGGNVPLLVRQVLLVAMTCMVRKLC